MGICQPQPCRSSKPRITRLYSRVPWGDPRRGRKVLREVATVAKIMSKSMNLNMKIVRDDYIQIQPLYRIGEVWMITAAGQRLNESVVRGSTASSRKHRVANIPTRGVDEAKSGRSNGDSERTERLLYSRKMVYSHNSHGFNSIGGCLTRSGPTDSPSDRESGKAGPKPRL
jgi:hypothetical protein